ncbi:HupE/UreJ family protein [Alphaproteobacteria bacterium KMM 3653]|uniref:HupE/UreJ family protein n=2 Tax=Harenicola maris TaxID=2841044 RepID=A0AAP2CS85_9RHOB|nr:HupE/UreJ family protein [Harenicola maris]
MGIIDPLVALKLTLGALVSSLIAVMCLAGPLAAHELRPAVGDVSVQAESVTLKIVLNAEAMLAGVDQAAGGNTDTAPEAADYDALRALDDAALAEAFRAEWEALSGGFDVKAGGQDVPLSITGLTVTPEPDAELPRDTVLELSGPLPEGDAPVTVGWTAAFGPMALRQVGGGEDAYSDFLNPGDTSAPLPRGEIATEGWGSVFGRYIIIGFEHIIPKGLDHILFVLGLFFFALKAKPLLMQVTAFTLAHTVTLALASLGIVNLPGSVVEPLIAASIVYVAVENILRPKLGALRTAVVFGFGLLHGLGFASVLGDVGLEPGRFVVGLIAFNIGVEIGQLTVIAIAFALVMLAVQCARSVDLPMEEDAVRETDVLYRAVSITGSLAIALMGAWWVIERTLL